MLGTKLPLHVSNGRTNVWKGDLMLAANSIENMRFDQIDERQSGEFRIGQADNRLEMLLTSFRGIEATPYPGAKSGERDAQVMCSLADAIGGQLSRISRCLD